MMSEFDYQLRTRVVYGIGRSKQLAQDVLELCEGKDVVLVTDPGLVKVGVADEILEILRAQRIEATLFSEVESDPSSASIDAAAAVLRSTNASCVIGLGGGSAMDVAKLAALVACAEYPTEHYALMANPFPSKRITTIMVPTTSGTGAEVTSTVVFSNSAKRKVWGWDFELAPDLAVLDPTLTVALPPHLTAATGLDALIHAIEAVTGKRSHPIIKAVGLQAIRLISSSLLPALENPQDLQAKGNLSVGSMLAGIAIEQGGTGIAHCIGHALGTLGRIHHGRAVAIAMYHTYEWNIQDNEEIFAEIALAMGAIEDYQASTMEKATAGLLMFCRLVEESGLSVTLRTDELIISDLGRLVETMASVENAPMRNNNCRYAEDEDLITFANQILE